MIPYSMQRLSRSLRTTSAGFLLSAAAMDFAAADQNYFWNSFTVGHKVFNTAANWQPATVPGPDDTAWITNFPAGYNLSWSAPVVNRKGILDLVDRNITVNLVNPDWALTESLTIGNRSSDSSKFVLSGGRVTITNSAGTGTLKVNWGTAGKARMQFRGQSLVADHIYSSNSYASAGLDVIDTGNLTTLGDSIFANGGSAIFYVGNYKGANAKWHILGGTSIVEQALHIGATGVYGGGNVGIGTGEVRVAGNNAVLRLKGGLSVGPSSAGVGFLTVTNGGTVRNTSGFAFGMNAGTGHRILVTGSNSLLVTTGQIYMYTSNSNNMIRVENGGRWRSESASGSGQMYFNGNFVPDMGIVIDGPGSVYEDWRDIYLGGVSWSAHGRGMIRIQNGGLMTTPNWAPTYIGGGSGRSRGDLAVTGPGSAFVFGSPLYVGTVGTGAVMIANGGLLQCGELHIGPVGKGSVTNHGGVLQFTAASPTINLAAPGTLIITNGSVSFRNVTTADIRGNVTGTKLTNAVFQGHNAFRLCNSSTAGSFQGYVFDKTPVPTAYARLEMVDGATRYRGPIRIGAEGSLLLSQTQATFDNIVTNQGLVTLVNATGTFTTALWNYGAIEGRGALAGPVTSFSGSRVAPGGETAGSITFAGTADLQAGTTLALNVDGAAAGTFDTLAVAAGGSLDIEGVALTVALGFAPAPGERFLVINKGAGTLTGQFANNGLDVAFNDRVFSLNVVYDAEGVSLVNVPQGTMMILR